MGPLLCFLVVLLFAGTQSCPEVCRCEAKKKYGRHIADCSYKDLQAVPGGLPSNATTITLSVNRITHLWEDSFTDAKGLQALWLSHNEIRAIAKGTFALLVQLRAIDLSHNQISDFPWGDLQNLTALQQLKFSYNRLERVPPGAFHTLTALRSLWLSDNRLTVLSEGTFDSLSQLSHLQINSNPFDCSCKSWWLRNWLEKTPVSVPERESITCAAPEKLKGLVLGKTLKLDCALPSVKLVYHSSLGNSVLHDGLTLHLHCSVVGKPPPQIQWRIQTSTQNVVLSGPNVEGQGDNSVVGVTPEQSEGHHLVFKNGSMVISRFSKTDEGVYTCRGSNELGSREASVSVGLASSENPATDVLQNNIQSSKSKSKLCDKEEYSKPEEKVVLIYLTPVAPKTSSGGTPREPWYWGSLFLLFLLAL
ncbi:Immunoglobulin superfamily containing leucine-rich repeat protein [Varanus komodoensis]|uniref:Ig-like domain-containing protein n=1 Tax=Varanus komodoensis TaxID=61221 RepID=A0A8D2KR81_VARKO|nr:immunoglobulin superfamily containing leucine-rich repeat protein-like [Varanus komodoensis]KAF7234921.1 Immunoglobulin superfamily containing leucine-rich repeat protein [Varanus komodoensis]